MHLTTETALDLTEGRLDRAQETFWQRHLDACKDCMVYIAEWRQLGVDLKRAHLQSATDQDLARAMNIFPHQPDEGGSRIRSVLAALVFDSFHEAAFAGARGTAGAARQLVMRAEEFDIHIKVWGEREHRQMLGQLLPRSGEDFVHTARFHLLRNGERLDSTAVDQTGEFRFSDVPEGDLSLQIDLPNLTVIGALNVKDPHQ